MDQAQVRAVGLETDNPVDDVSVSLGGPWTALVQAKRTLDAGSSLTKATEQWVDAVRGGVDLERTRLVIASGHLSGSMRVLRELLEREKLDEPGADTQRDSSIRRTLREKLVELTDEEFRLVLKAAVIWEIQVERIADSGAQVAIGLLRPVLRDPARAESTWGITLQEAGRIARLRGGNSIDAWLQELRAAGVNFGDSSETPAGIYEKRESALERYRLSVIRRGSEIDLRALGATISNVSLDEADAGVLVERRVDHHTMGRPLTWTFLRHVRSILTGLPGAGKSTAIWRLAAELCADPRLPLPLVCSLKEVNRLDNVIGFRDRIVTIALKDCTTADREILTQEFESRLDGGRPVAILLDALDETYDDRADVVSSIGQLSTELDLGVCILVSSRDVAYAHAETLGWPHAKLMAPSNSRATIDAILRIAAPNRDGVSAGEWIEERRRWVQDALASDEILRETPLMVVLLTLLAARADAQALPRRRADVLRHAVEEVVQRRELRRRDGRPIGRLAGSALPIAGQAAFALEAKTLMDGKGTAGLHELVRVVGTELATLWSLPAGEAAAAATDAVRLFDESGIFTISASGIDVTPRIHLFAEIGDALYAVAHPSTLSTWVSERVEGEDFEPVILACALEPLAGAAAIHELGADPSNVGLARALVRAMREGASLPARARLEVLSSLVETLRAGTVESWECWDDVLDLDPSPKIHPEIIEAARSHSEQHALVAHMTLVMRFTEPSPEKHLGMMRELMTLAHLPESASGRGTESRDVLSALIPVRHLAQAQILVAQFLVEHSPDSAALLMERISNGPTMLRDPLTEALRTHGHEDEIRELEEEHAAWPGFERITSLLNEQAVAREHETIDQIADWKRAPVSGREAIALDSLATLLQTLGLENYGDAFHGQAPGDRLAVLTTAAELLGLSTGELATEAAVLKERMGALNDLAPFYAMFDPPSPARTPDWSRVGDVHAAVRALVSQFWLTRGQAEVAAKLLWSMPDATIAADLLRDLVPKLRDSPQHERLAALTLASLANQPEPTIWLTDEDPVLRAAAAIMTEFERDQVDGRLAHLVNDPDGHVQEAAIGTLERINPPGARAVLEAVVNRGDPGWQCLSCRTENPPGSRECGKSGCYRAPARPTSRARDALQRTEPA